MIKVENIDVYGFEHAVKAMRNPMSSWEKSDSYVRQADGNGLEISKYDEIGSNDLDLMRRLYRAGTEHRTYARMIYVWMDITAPLYLWKEMDRYTVGKSQVSTSTMHKIHAKEFTGDDFSIEHLISEYNHQDYKDVYYEDRVAEKRIIEGYTDYLISEDGIVYSMKTGEERKLVQRVDIDGYKTVGLYNNGKCKRFKVHRLVANAFLEKDAKRDCINHIDGNKWNNTKENLEWCTRKENQQHAYANGLARYGSKQRIGSRKAARFSSEQIEAIKQLSKEGYSQRKLGEMFGCDHSTICDIVNGRLYKEIQIAPWELMEIIIDELNSLRDAYNETGDKKYWYSIIQLLPSSYNQKRTVCMSYEVVFKIIRERTGHKLDEWNDFVKILRDLPYVKEIMETENAAE